MHVDFDWTGNFGYVSIEDTNISKVDPLYSPLMTGGVFAINRNFFWKNGGYDTGRTPGWGGENFELSFKTWLCGGRLDIIPCSHVAHLDRHYQNRPYGNKDESHWINLVRVANIWMDEYKSLFQLNFGVEYVQDPRAYSIEDQLKLKKKLNCKSFSWYVEYIIPGKFIPQKHARMHGRVRNGAKEEICLDNLQVGTYNNSGKLGRYPCYSSPIASTQYFALSLSHELRVAFDVYCAEVSKQSPFDRIELKKCNGNSNQKWKWTADEGLKHLLSGKCVMSSSILDGSSQNGEFADSLITYDCVGWKEQMWNFEFSSNLSSPIITFPKTKGRIRNNMFENFCLDDYSQQAPYFLQLFPCIDDDEKSETQNFYLTSDQELRHIHDCAEMIPCDSKDFCTTSHLILMTSCNGKEEQKWKLTKGNGLQHVKSKLCLKASLNQDKEGVNLIVDNCRQAANQIWKFEL